MAITFVRRDRVRARGAIPMAAVAMALALFPATASAAPSVAGCVVFPADNVWNTDISSLPVHSQSSAWLGNMGGAGRLLHPDFGSSGDPSAPYGIPYTVVDASHPKVQVSFHYSGESDHVPYPFGADTPIEGGQYAGGDRHALMIDRSSCVLYELYDAHYSPGGSTAGSGAVFNLAANGPLRPATWTSADAAGLPIFPGLLRRDEVQAGRVSHAIRFTAQQTDRSFIWPARHQAGSASNSALPPMGARFRLRSGFDISRYRADTQVMLTAMKHFGLILADNGSNWFFQGAADNGWDNSMIGELKSVPAGAFDAVDESGLMIDPNSGQARQPGGAAPGGRSAPAPASEAPTEPPLERRQALGNLPPFDGLGGDRGGEAIASGGAGPRASRVTAPMIVIGVIVTALVTAAAAGVVAVRRLAPLGDKRRG